MWLITLQTLRSMETWSTQAGPLRKKKTTSPRGKEETRSDEDEVPLPQPGDMHVEFKSQASLIEQRNLRLNLFLFVYCRKINRNYAEEYQVLSRRSMI